MSSNIIESMNIAIIIPLILGVLAGWIINYLGDVLPFTRRFSQPTCQNCQSTYKWKAYLLLHICQTCNHKRGMRTIITFLVVLTATLYIWLVPPTRVGFILGYILFIYLGVVLVIDLEHRLIMHPVSYVGAVLGLVIGSYAHGILPALIGGVFGFGFMLVMYFLGGYFSRYMAKRRGQEIEEVALGFGDVNLSGITGLLLGWPVILAGVIFTLFAGGIGSLIVIVYMLIRKRYQAFTPIPYAPFLILSILFYLYR